MPAEHQVVEDVGRRVGDVVDVGQPAGDAERPDQGQHPAEAGRRDSNVPPAITAVLRVKESPLRCRSSIRPWAEGRLRSLGRTVVGNHRHRLVIGSAVVRSTCRGRTCAPAPAVPRTARGRLESRRSGQARARTPRHPGQRRYRRRGAERPFVAPTRPPRRTRRTRHTRRTRAVPPNAVPRSARPGPRPTSTRTRPHRARRHRRRRPCRGGTRRRARRPWMTLRTHHTASSSAAPIDRNTPTPDARYCGPCPGWLPG